MSKFETIIEELKYDYPQYCIFVAHIPTRFLKLNLIPSNAKEIKEGKYTKSTKLSTYMTDLGVKESFVKDYVKKLKSVKLEWEDINNGFLVRCKKDDVDFVLGKMREQGYEFVNPETYKTNTYDWSEYAIALRNGKILWNDYSCVKDREDLEFITFSEFKKSFE